MAHLPILIYSNTIFYVPCTFVLHSHTIYFFIALRQAVNEQDFLQSIMQIMNRVVTSAAATATTTEPSAPPSTETTSTATTSASNQTAGSGQNSQARGNTQTNPTTSTHTRSTSRPHVHLAQHAMQGFDPFLPCNSHHVTSR